MIWKLFFSNDNRKAVVSAVISQKDMRVAAKLAGFRKNFQKFDAFIGEINKF